MNVSCITPNFSFSYGCFGGIDTEEKEIMERLLAYGCTPTGDKSTDKAKLRRIEIQKAKEDNYVSDKYLTVSKAECEKIQEQKKSKRKLNNVVPECNIKGRKPDRQVGAELLGQQIYLAIQMKSEKDKKRRLLLQKAA